jgi:2-polyprenyl-3-methyl-5-hydroxy-6-metoxy-1,4-benzoquinol methylase
METDVMEEKTLSCPLCGNKEYKLFNVEATHEQMRWNCWGYEKLLLECQECQLKFLYPKWSEEELKSLYSGYKDVKDFKGQIQAKRVSNYLVDFFKKTDNILEIGCGTGDNLKHYRSLGYLVYGIDKDDTVCDGQIVKNKDYRDLNKKEMYDKIYAVQVFEHIQEPKEFITAILNHLNKGGKFLLELPNTEDPILTLYHIQKFKKFYYIPHHVFFWTPSTIQRFFDSMGVKIEIKLYQKYGILNHLRWIFLGKPGNWHPHVPVVDGIYKWILTNIFKRSDTLIIIGESKNGR